MLKLNRPVSDKVVEKNQETTFKFNLLGSQNLSDGC